jgi:hypothetical protein
MHAFEVFAILPHFLARYVYRTIQAGAKLHRYHMHSMCDAKGQDERRYGFSIIKAGLPRRYLMLFCLFQKSMVRYGWWLANHDYILLQTLIQITLGDTCLDTYLHHTMILWR